MEHEKKPAKSKKSRLSQSYLRLSQILIFAGILLTGIFMVSLAVGEYRDQIKRNLLNNCDALIANISDVYVDEEHVLSEEVHSLIRTAEQQYRYRIYLYDADGREIYPVPNDSFLTPSTRSLLRTEDYMQIGKFTEDATDEQICCVTRFFVKGQDDSNDQYYLSALTDASGLVAYSQKLITMLGVALIVAMLLFMLLFRVGASRLDRQFDDINHVVEQYAEGEFSARAALSEHDDLYAFACTLHRMAELIEQNETTRKNFIANVSHELRTPMTTIGGFANGILDGTIPPEQHTKYMRIISEEIQRLRTLVNSMLNLTKFEAGEMQLRCTNLDVAQLLIKTVLMFEKRITDKKVEVEGLEEASLQIQADADLMFQVLYNLIENAVKFVNTGGVISFSLCTEGKMAHICVKNTGEGLADEELSRIFDRFYKTDTSRSQDKTGLGLGLSIAKKIVHLHQGHIVVKSVKGEYTAFEVQVPLHQKHQET